MHVTACVCACDYMCMCMSLHVTVVPQQGALHLQTEFGHLYVEPNEIAVVQVRNEKMIT